MSALGDAVARAEARYVDSRPESAALHVKAEQHLAGGSARSVLSFTPFPFRVARASGGRITDVDGHELVDFCGDYTAGLLGHNPDAVDRAIRRALDGGWALGAGHELEIEAARLICDRFEGIDLVRFANSGTEANLLAVATAVHHTGRDKVLAFSGGYHGSVLNFATDKLARKLNAPYRFAVAAYNDVASARREFDGDPPAAVLVEPMQGAGGCFPANAEFLRYLRSACDDAGAVLIFDEVMTSRLHPGGLQSYFGVIPDLTTLGKYLAGGLSFGAFGGNRAIMAHFAGGPERLQHSGTFNNNVFSMSAVVAVLGECLTADSIVANTERGNRLRLRIADALSQHRLPVTVTGFGSMLCLHAEDDRLVRWLFLDLLQGGYYISSRGMITLSFEVSDADCAALAERIAGWAETAERVIAAERGGRVGG